MNLNLIKKSMNKVIAVILLGILIFNSYACGAGSGGTSTVTTAVAADNGVNTDTTDSNKTASDNSSTKESASGIRDCYADEDYSFPKENYINVRDGVDYGTLIRDVSYYSQAAGRDKTFAIVLPANYSTDEEYPVMYCLHGFGGCEGEWEFVQTVGGNMVADGIAKKCIFVLVDMWTDPREYSECDDWAHRLGYDKFVEDLENDLMPYIESHYSVKTGRENTAIAGLSQGGTESLAIGFLLQNKIGYTLSLAPAPGVIPTTYYEGTYWNIPIMDDFVIESEESTPLYLLLAIGSYDPWDIPCTEYYVKVLNEKNIKNKYYMLDGYSHDFDMWSHGFYNFYKRIF